jgi:hypothetical protein
MLVGALSAMQLNMHTDASLMSDLHQDPPVQHDMPSQVHMAHMWMQQTA